jgi:hypothetical protein
MRGPKSRFRVVPQGDRRPTWAARSRVRAGWARSATAGVFLAIATGLGIGAATLLTDRGNAAGRHAIEGPTLSGAVGRAMAMAALLLDLTRRPAPAPTSDHDPA